VVAQPQPGQGGKGEAGHERQQPRHEVDFTAPKDAVDEARAEIEADECGSAVAPVARGQGFEGGEDGGHGVQDDFIAIPLKPHTALHLLAV